MSCFSGVVEITMSSLANSTGQAALGTRADQDRLIRSKTESQRGQIAVRVCPGSGGMHEVPNSDAPQVPAHYQR